MSDVRHCVVVRPAFPCYNIAGEIKYNVDRHDLITVNFDGGMSLEELLETGHDLWPGTYYIVSGLIESEEESVGHAVVALNDKVVHNPGPRPVVAPAPSVDLRTRESNGTTWFVDFIGSGAACQ